MPHSARHPLRFTLLFAQLQETLLLASVDETPIYRARRNSCEIKRFGSECCNEGSDVLHVSGGNRKARHAPKVDGFLDCLFQVLEVYLFDVRHKNYYCCFCCCCRN